MENRKEPSGFGMGTNVDVDADLIWNWLTEKQIMLPVNWKQ